MFDLTSATPLVPIIVKKLTYAAAFIFYENNAGTYLYTAGQRNSVNF